MKFVFAFIFLLSFLSKSDAQKIKLPVLIADAEKQTQLMLTEVLSLKTKSANPSLVSPRTIDNDELKLVSAKDWTSGFFPGKLWLLYEMTGRKDWEDQAEIFTANVEAQKYDRTTHDLGFQIFCSAGNGYRLTRNAAYKADIIQAAITLSKRFNAVAGVIKSWDNPKWTYPTIIDNMMNLELLFEATKLSGDSSFYKIAVMHANTTMRNHFRSDYSSYHVLDYDTLNAGNVISKTTAQGYANESAWARGQAWALYGFTMCYRETKDPAYLELAKHIASFILSNPNLPADMIPYWDYNAPDIPNAPRDVSAAAITASALYELSGFDNKKYYLGKADKIMQNLAARYRSNVGESKGFILLHSTGALPYKSEIDVPIIYADYYYLEALDRSKKLKEGKGLF